MFVYIINVIEAIILFKLKVNPLKIKFQYIN